MIFYLVQRILDKDVTGINETGLWNITIYDKVVGGGLCLPLLLFV